MVTTVETRQGAFPENWNDPVADNATFMFDPMHFPYPNTPLTHSSLGPAFSAGFTQAAREFNTPIHDVQVLSRNLYHFERYEMLNPANEEEARLMGERAEATLKPELGRLLDRWNEEHLPAIKAHLERVRAMEIETSPDHELAAFVDELDTIHRDIWLIHFRIAIPMLLGMQIFDEFYFDVFGGEMGDGHSLLLGVSSESVKAGHGLYDLTIKAKSLGLEEIIRGTPATDLINVLNGSGPGREFVSALQAYLNIYGYRQDLFEFATPTWIEDPSIALASVKNYLLADRDERSVYETTKRDAEAALDAARTTLSMYPEAVRGQFEGCWE